MSEETLLSAARRMVRFFNIDQQHGGLVSIDTLKASMTLDIQVGRETDRLKAAGEWPPKDSATPVSPAPPPAPVTPAAAESVA